MEPKKPNLITSPFAPMEADTPIARMMNAWWGFGQVIKQRIAPMLEREHGLDFGNFITLNAIHSGSSYPTHLCERLVMHPSHVSRMIEILVTRGFITRALDPDDSRRVRLEITPQGRAILEEARATMTELLEVGFKDVPESQLETLAETIHRAHRAMSAALNTTATTPVSGKPKR